MMLKISPTATPVPLNLKYWKSAAPVSTNLYPAVRVTLKSTFPAVCVSVTVPYGAGPAPPVTWSEVKSKLIACAKGAEMTAITMVKRIGRYFSLFIRGLFLSIMKSKRSK